MRVFPSILWVHVSWKIGFALHFALVLFLNILRKISGNFFTSIWFISNIPTSTYTRIKIFYLRPKQLFFFFSYLRFRKRFNLLFLHVCHFSGIVVIFSTFASPTFSTKLSEALLHSTSFYIFWPYITNHIFEIVFVFSLRFVEEKKSKRYILILHCFFVFFTNHNTSS